MTSAQVNPSPKTRFQTDSNISEHHALMETPAFDRAIDAALLEYHRGMAEALAKSPNPQVEGMVDGWKMAGAHEFIDVLRKLAEKPVVTQVPGIARTLNQKA